MKGTIFLIFFLSKITKLVLTCTQNKISVSSKSIKIISIFSNEIFNLTAQKLLCIASVDSVIFDFVFVYVYVFFS